MGSHTFSVRATTRRATWTPRPRRRHVDDQLHDDVDHQPVAAYVYSPTAPVTGQAVTFDASSATCADAPCTYTWTDDGYDGAGGVNWALGSGKVLTFTFTGAGVKNIRLTVKDADGDTASIVKSITVKAAGTAARFTR